MIQALPRCSKYAVGCSGPDFIAGNTGYGYFNRVINTQVENIHFGR